jgi:hypothetical protein
MSESVGNKMGSNLQVSGCPRFFSSLIPDVMSVMKTADRIVPHGGEAIYERTAFSQFRFIGMACTSHFERSFGTKVFFQIKFFPTPSIMIFLKQKQRRFFRLTTLPPL